jgi:carboxyl-terminal processing protease
VAECVCYTYSISIRGVILKRLPSFLLLPLVFVAGAFFQSRAHVSFSKSSVGSLNASAGKLDYSSVDEAYGKLVANYDGTIDSAKVIDGLKKGLAESTGDPYTEYFPAEDAKGFQEQISGSFSGIGAELGKENNAVTVIAPIKGFPAEKAGLQSKDVILKINDEDALSLSIGDAVKKIRGPKDTTVKLSVLRGGTEQLDISIVRADIKIPSVVSEVLDGGVCSIAISRFSDDTDTFVSGAAKTCKDKSATSVLLDLRGNPGGYLDQAIKVASHWVKQGDVVVSEKRGGKVIKSHVAVAGQEFAGMKTIALVDGGSASASEIVAGALHDHGLATLVGTKTYGKGSVQEVDPLAGGTTIKITIARWFTPNDKNIDKQGIEPDTKVEPTKEDLAAKNDIAKTSALGLLKQ